MVVFIVGTFFATEKFTMGVAANMLVVGTGIAIASYGKEAQPHIHGCQGLLLARTGALPAPLNASGYRHSAGASLGPVHHTHVMYAPAHTLGVAQQASMKAAGGGQRQAACQPMQPGTQPGPWPCPGTHTCVQGVPLPTSCAIACSA